MDFKFDSRDMQRLIVKLENAPRKIQRQGQGSFEAMAYSSKTQIKTIMPKLWHKAANSWGTPGAGDWQLEYDGDEWANIIGGLHYIEYLAEGSSPQQPNPGWMWDKVYKRNLEEFGKKMTRLVSNGKF